MVTSFEQKLWLLGFGVWGLGAECSQFATLILKHKRVLSSVMPRGLGLLGVDPILGCSLAQMCVCALLLFSPCPSPYAWYSGLLPRQDHCWCISVCGAQMLLLSLLLHLTVKLDLLNCIISFWESKFKWSMDSALLCQGEWGLFLMGFLHSEAGPTCQAQLWGSSLLPLLRAVLWETLPSPAAHCTHIGGSSLP